MIGMLIGVLALVAGESIAVPTVAVSGSCRCPTPADVQAQIAALPGRGPAPTAAERHDALLTCSADGIVDVVLRRANGDRIADRALAAQGSCGDLAAAIAVIIGAWEGDLDPRVSTAVSLPTPAASAPPAASSAAAAPATPPPPAPPPAAPVDTAAKTRAASAPHLSAGRLAFSIDVGLLASLTGSQVTPGATVGADLFPARSRLGLAAAVTATTSRDSSVGALSGVVARWSRITLGLGPDLRFSLGAIHLDLQAAGVAALLSVAGSGSVLVSPSSDSSVQLGASLGMRGSWAWGTSALWAGAQMLLFPGDDHLVVSGLPGQGQLPHVELQLAAGVGLGRFP